MPAGLPDDCWVRILNLNMRLGPCDGELTWPTGDWLFAADDSDPDALDIYSCDAHLEAYQLERPYHNP